MKIFITYIIFIAGVMCLGFVCWICQEIYIGIRKKLNKPTIGIVGILINRLESGDYVCINGRVLRFSHVAHCGEHLSTIKPPFDDNLTNGGELSFDNPNGLDNIYYTPACLKNCQFIFGKYGLKWALNLEFANKAKEIIENSNVI